MLPRFNIIVATDKDGGISSDNKIPWNYDEVFKFSRQTTVGKFRNKNYVIMGRRTFETIPKNQRPLSDRQNVIITRTLKQEEYPNLLICTSFEEALISIGHRPSQYNEIFIIGGEQIYNLVVDKYLYLCDKIYITKFKSTFNCDKFFPLERVSNLPRIKNDEKTMDYIRMFIKPNIKHQEYQFLDLLKKLNDNGDMLNTEFGMSKRLFGERIEFNVCNEIPLITTRKMDYEGIIRDLIFCVSGKTDSEIIKRTDVLNKYDKFTDRSYLDSLNLEYEEGDVGPFLGFQLRHYGEEYDGYGKTYEGIDQLNDLITKMKEGETNDLILIMDNPEQRDIMNIKPNELSAQYNISPNKKYLDCQLYIKSVDVFTELPDIIFFYSLIMYMISHLVNLKPRKLIIVMGDSYILDNYQEYIDKEIKRVPKPFPTLRFRNLMKLKKMEDFEENNYIVENYNSWSKIQLTY